ncbi:hypothetical protein ACFOW4_00565 [Micromonospora sp. GCM10011542]|uniref:hypothetical protein n=1 Tax=Micromonospora sp. GCM10011542 TaxID=3317337 RepID=UPI00360A9E8D
MKTRPSVRLALLVGATGLVVVVGTGFMLTRGDSARSRTCEESAALSAAKVRTDLGELAEEVPGLGEPVEIHWQVRVRGNPCSRVPGPTDRAYQGVVTLRPQDARRLSEQHGFTPFSAIDPGELDHSSTPADVWPDLVPFLPPEPRWRYSASYNALPPSYRWRVAFLDLEHHTLAFMLYDH